MQANSTQSKEHLPRNPAPQPSSQIMVHVLTNTHARRSAGTNAHMGCMSARSCSAVEGQRSLATFSHYEMLQRPQYVNQPEACTALVAA